MKTITKEELDRICYSQNGMPRRSGRYPWGLGYDPHQHNPVIKKVIFNDPATIVIWDDGTKTVVKCCEDDEFDPEKGLAMAISKKALGGSLKEVRKWTDEYYKEQEEINPLFYKIAETFRKIL